uniref:hypothetical protein n=1 Tax=Agathobacter sp. TaxID=2021311 RepID=UPI004056EE88
MGNANFEFLRKSIGDMGDAMLDKVQDEIYFHTFLKTRREMMGVALAKLAKGICNASTILRMEQDEYIPEKMIRNRIVARLGISGEKYEDYLPPKEYERWMHRQDILGSIERKRLSEAEELLEKYKKDAPKNAVEKQFIAAMHFMLLQMRNAPFAEQREAIEAAVKETVKRKGDEFPEKLLLADQEINLLIEYAALHGTGTDGKETAEWRLNEYRKIIAYIENSYMDNLGKAKVYPKVVCYWMKLVCDYYEGNKLDIPWEIVEYGLEVCDRAIELLRDTEKMFYFMELLEKRKFFIHKKLQYMKEDEVNELRVFIEKGDLWYKVLMELYKEYEVSPYMEHFCHLYWEMQSYPMGEVIRTRRKMMRMTKEELSDDTCDLKSITRCEKDRVKTQKYTVRGLFPKVGLGTENICGSVVTNDFESLELYDEMIRYANSVDLEKWEECHNVLKRKLRTDIPENKQVIEMSNNLLLRYRSMISNEEFEVNIRNSLQSTISLECIMNYEKRHLTQKELFSVYKIATVKEGKEKEKYLSVLKGIFEKYEDTDRITPYISEYEFIMTGISSWLGNIEDYRQSNKISKRIIKECLRHRRIGVLGMNQYHILWNNHQKTDTKIIEDKELLVKCKVLCEIVKNTNWIEFLKEKISNIEK